MNETCDYRISPHSKCPDMTFETVTLPLTDGGTHDFCLCQQHARLADHVLAFQSVVKEHGAQPRRIEAEDLIPGRLFIFAGTKAHFLLDRVEGDSVTVSTESRMVLGLTVEHFKSTYRYADKRRNSPK